MIKITGISSKVRQIAVKNIGRDEPTLLITNDVTTAGKSLFARYAERMMVENELDAYIGGVHLHGLPRGVPPHLHPDTPLTLLPRDPYPLLALQLHPYPTPTPHPIWRDVLVATPTLPIHDT